ncbi:MAG: zinc-binding dehydrogenase [Anaerolineae bacterium]
MHTLYVELTIPRVLATRALARLWRGAYFSRVSPLQEAQTPTPPLPSPHSVRVRNRLSLICGSDLHLAFAEGDLRVAPGILPGNQRIYLGHELCGEVVEVGPAVTRVRPGDRVALRYFNNTCATQGIIPACRHCQDGNYCLCEHMSDSTQPPSIGGGWSDEFIAHEDQLFAAPEQLTDEQIASIEPAAVGVRAVLQARLQPGDRATVLGCGIIGLMVIQALKALYPDVHVTALARYPFQGDAARRLGADEVRVRQDGYEVTAEITGARLYRGKMGGAMLLGGFDVVFDCVGNARTITDSLRWARAGGQVVLVGIQFLPLTVDLTPVWYQEVQLLGTMSHGSEVWQGERIGTFELTARLMAEGKITTEGLITHRFPLSRWREAIMTATDKRRHRSIKVAFTFE